MKRTINKANWSGEDITVELAKDKLAFELFGYKYTLSPLTIVADIDGDSKWDFLTHTVSWAEGDDDHGDLVKVSKFRKDANWSGELHGINREADEPWKVAVQIACNCI